MRDLRTIRIFLAVLFFAASATYLFIGAGVSPMARAAYKVQIIPSALAATAGATAFWLVATFFFGRLYCSTVCPVGTLQDSATWLRRKIGETRRGAVLRNPFDGSRLFGPYRPRKTSRIPGLVLIGYAGFLIIGFLAIATLLEPWNLMRSAARLTNPDAGARWMLFAGNAALGGAVAVVILALIWIWALLRGREFCRVVCPIGTCLSLVGTRAVWHIEIDPDRCTNCLRCQDVCKTGCINVTTREVNDAACIRCFDCLKVCADDAIRYQSGRNRPANPLMTRNPE